MRKMPGVNRKDFPYITVGLIVLNVIYFIIVALGGNPANSNYMLSRGADYAPYVFERYEYWRLLTSMFMHFSISHLASNMIYLGIVGATYEKIIGRVKFLLIYMLSGIGGGVISCAYHRIAGLNAVSAGASGAVYGLIGLVVYLSFIARKRVGTTLLLRRVGIMLIFMLYSNFSGGRGIDVSAHIGGLFFGVLMSALLLPAKKKK